MDELVERRTIEAALEAAAHVAQHGSSRARSGQIDAPTLQMQRVAGRLAREAQDACGVWANWEAINSALGAQPHIAEALQFNDIAWNLGPIRTAFFRDAMRGIYRLSDQYDARKDPDKITLCRLAHVLDDETNRAQLADRDWALDIGHKPIVAEAAAAANAERIVFLRSLVASKWTSVPPHNPELFDLRERFKPVRDKILAHAVDVDDLDHPTIAQMRRLMDLTLELCTSMAFLFVGSCASEESIKERAKEQSERFWALAFQAPVAKMRDMKTERREKLGDAAQ
jgi:hypothetical protein